MDPNQNNQTSQPPVNQQAPNQTPPPQQPTDQNQENQSNQNPPKKKSGLWKIIALVIVLVLLGVSGAAGYMIYQNMTQDPEQTACTLEAKVCPDGSTVGRQGPNCEFAPCPTATPNPTAEWETYRNTFVGFEIQYPEQYSPPSLPSGPGEERKADGTETNNHIIFSLNSQESFGIQVFPYRGTLNGLISNEKTEAVPIYDWEGKNSTVTTKQTQVDSTDALLLTGNYKESTELPFKIVIFMKNGYGFVVNFSQNYTETQIDQILSTFEFTNEENSSSPVSWEEAVALIEDCEVEQVFQTHSLEVTLTLNDGSQVTTTGPAIDDVFDVVQEAESECGTIPIATE